MDRELYRLRAMIINHIEQGKKLKKYQEEVLQRYATELKIPEERLSGFIEGLVVTLRMIAEIEKGE